MVITLGFALSVVSYQCTSQWGGDLDIPRCKGMEC